MQEIKDWLHSHQILPRISFKDRKEHTIEIAKARAESFNNDKDELVEGIKFLVKEDGEPKTFFTASQDLLLKLANSQEGEVYMVKMCAKNVGGIVKTYYEVKKVEGENEVQIEHGDEIPVVDNEEGTSGKESPDEEDIGNPPF